MPVSKKEISPCPIDAMLSVIDGRWKGTILWRLSAGPMRTSELRRSIPEITERMLIRHLHELVRDGVLIRHQERAFPRVCAMVADLLDFLWHYFLPVVLFFDRKGRTMGHQRDYRDFEGLT